MQRVLVSLSPGVEATRVVGELRALGADADEPAPELPDVIVARVAERRVVAFCRTAAGIPGVLVAEPDVLRYTQEPDAEPDAEPDLAPGWSSTEPE